MDNSTRVHLMSTAAHALLRTMEEALQHVRDPVVVVRPLGLQIRALCDFCSTGLFASSYLCRICGQEYCIPCRQTMVAVRDALVLDTSSDLFQCSRKTKRCTHDANHLLPLSRFNRDTIERETQAMREMVVSSGAYMTSPLKPSSVDRLDDREENDNKIRQACRSSDDPHEADRTCSAVPTHDLAKYDIAAMSETDFLDTWKRGEPLLVNNARTRTVWDPFELQERYGDLDCTIVRCDDEPELMRPAELKEVLAQNPAYYEQWMKPVKVRDFFATFGTSTEERRTLLGEGIWKLKDWPPTDEFQYSFPDMYAEFNAAVPMPDYTRRDGCKNLSSLFPKNANMPDLGPKMYNAWPGEHGKGKKGTTRLHMDIADAVNILLYASEQGEMRGDRQDSGAQWDIFRAEDAPLIREFLRETFNIPEDRGDPIHSQVHFLDDDLLQKLYRSKGVYSWRILQGVHQAVFIPAGCAHQVCNLTDCIKIAVDFLSPQNVQRCFSVTEEFRGMSGANRKSWKEDVLQLRAQLWYAWCACRQIGQAPVREVESDEQIESPQSPALPSPLSMAAADTDLQVEQERGSTDCENGVSMHVELLPHAALPINLAKIAGNDDQMSRDDPIEDATQSPTVSLDATIRSDSGFLSISATPSNFTTGVYGQALQSRVSHD